MLFGRKQGINNLHNHPCEIHIIGPIWQVDINQDSTRLTDLIINQHLNWEVWRPNLCLLAHSQGLYWPLTMQSHSGDLKLRYNPDLQMAAAREGLSKATILWRAQVPRTQQDHSTNGVPGSCAVRASSEGIESTVLTTTTTDEWAELEPQFEHRANVWPNIIHRHTIYRAQF